MRHAGRRRHRSSCPRRPQCRSSGASYCSLLSAPELPRTRAFPRSRPAWALTHPQPDAARTRKHVVFVLAPTVVAGEASFRARSTESRPRRRTRRTRGRVCRGVRPRVAQPLDRCSGNECAAGAARLRVVTGEARCAAVAGHKYAERGGTAWWIRRRAPGSRRLLRRRPCTCHAGHHRVAGDERVVSVLAGQRVSAHAARARPRWRAHRTGVRVAGVHERLASVGRAAFIQRRTRRNVPSACGRARANEREDDAHGVGGAVPTFGVSHPACPRRASPYGVEARSSRSARGPLSRRSRAHP